MKIYQLHEYGGEYEDYFDRIIGSYLHKERAEEEKFRAETEERILTEQAEKCENCPFLTEQFSDLDKLWKAWNGYCCEAKLREDIDGSIYCCCSCCKREDLSFEIKEVEVEE